MSECTETGKKIQIFLSTFNGEVYLREQLNSFLSLSNFNQVKVTIRDDGSDDSTLKILNEYKKKYGFDIIVGENIGVNASLYELFNHCDLSFDYFAISDQDDVWLPYKFQLALQYLDKMDDKCPNMFSSCSQIVDEKLYPLGKTLAPRKGLDFYNAMVQNVMPGHTQVFNRALMKVIRDKFDHNIHVVDWWLYLIVSALGGIAFDEKATVLHRQHRSNAVGYELSIIRKILQRVKSVRSHKANAITKQLKAFYEKYGNEIPDEYCKEVLRYLQCQKTLLDRVKYVLSTKAYRQTGIETILFKALYVLGKYKL